MDPLIVILRKIRLRLTVRQWIQFAVYGISAAAIASCVCLLTTRSGIILGDPAPAYALLLGAAVLGAVVAAVWRRPSLLRSALEGDRTFRLAERLTSSYELSDAEHPMVQALHADARGRLAGLNVRQGFPLATKHSLRWAYVPVLLFLLAYLLLPEFDILGRRARQAEAKAHEEELRVKAEILRNAAKPIQRIPEQTHQASLDAMEGLERLADDLQNDAINEKQALARLTNLAKTLDQQRNKFQAENPMPKLAADTTKLDTTQDIAKALQKKDFGKAAEKLNEMQKKLEEGGLSQEQMKALSEEMNQLADMMAKMNMDSQLSQELAEALKNAGQCMCESGQLSETLDALEQAQLSLKDLESIAKQLEQMETLLAECGNCMGCLGGQCPGRYAGIGGNWQEGEGPWGGGGMGRRGTGRGGRVGDLPDVDGAYDATMLPGDLTKGKILASILQRGAPNEDAQSSREYAAGAFVEVRQQAEQALNKEEIPPGSKEFVRQYFGSLDPTSQSDDADGTAE
ncbi:MAG TPA: hypothetical protein HPP83_05300 [Candidatus Hydrogenedentes bacterium]|nr:hypothetical protein [Candidatus Hydrogenedentota bacterium]